MKQSVNKCRKNNFCNLLAELTYLEKCLAYIFHKYAELTYIEKCWVGRGSME